MDFICYEVFKFLICGEEWRWGRMVECFVCGSEIEIGEVELY